MCPSSRFHGNFWRTNPILTKFSTLHYPMNILFEFEDGFHSSTIYSCSSVTLVLPLVLVEILNHYNFRKVHFHIELKRIVDYSMSFQREFHSATEWYEIIGINKLRWKICLYHTFQTLRKIHRFWHNASLIRDYFPWNRNNFSRVDRTDESPKWKKILWIILLCFQFSPFDALKNKKQSQYSFSLFEVQRTREFKSESFLTYFLK